MKNLIIRTLSGAVLAVVVLGAALISPSAFALLLLVILVGGQWEFYRLSRRAGAAPQRWMGLIAGISIYLTACLLFYLLALGDFSLVNRTLPLVLGVLFLWFLLLAPILLMLELGRRSANPIASLGATFTGIHYVALPLSMLLFVPALAGSAAQWDGRIMVFFILLVWANDSMAYLVGTALGRHRMCSRISPKKSWEGFAGGIAGALLMGWIASRVLDASLEMWLGLALVTAVAGVMGDLVESMFKRSADVKDSGAILPGHGGWLDRFDALLLASPFAFAYLFIVNLIQSAL